MGGIAGRRQEGNSKDPLPVLAPIEPVNPEDPLALDNPIVITDKKSQLLQIVQIPHLEALVKDNNLALFDALGCKVLVLVVIEVQLEGVGWLD